MIQLPVDPDVRKAARIIAVRCRRVVQAVLRDEESGECDREFAEIAERVIKELIEFKGMR